MSPSLRESIRVGLFPDQVVFARYARGLRPRPIEKGILPVEAGSADEPWRTAVAALASFLRARALRPADAVVVLSNHFVRYLLLDSSERLSSREEWQEYAIHRFEKTYGMRAREWDIRVAESRSGHPRLASAIDKTLIEATGVACKNSRARLRSIQPYLMTAFNQVLPAMRKASFWFVLEEPGRLLLGLIRDGVWRSVRGRRANACWRDELPQILEREVALLAPEEPCREVLVSALDAVEAGAMDGFQVAAPLSPPADQDRIYSVVRP